MRNALRGARYANVTSTMALVVALGGTGAYAANTIRSSDIVNGQVKRVDLANNAVTSAKVKDGSLLKKDFNASELASLRGATGAAGTPGTPGTPGAKGDTGAQGVAGAAGATNVVVRTNTAQVPAGTTGSAVAACNPGERATGGGGVITGIFNQDAIVRSYPTTGGTGTASAGEVPTAWFVRVFNSDANERTMTTTVVCASP